MYIFMYIYTYTHTEALECPQRSKDIYSAPLLCPILPFMLTFSTFLTLILSLSILFNSLVICFRIILIHELYATCGTQWKFVWIIYLCLNVLLLNSIKWVTLEHLEVLRWFNLIFFQTTRQVYTTRVLVPPNEHPWDNGSMVRTNQYNYGEGNFADGEKLSRSLAIYFWQEGPWIYNSTAGWVALNKL